MNFTARLRSVQTEINSMLCVGIDPDPARMPPGLLRTMRLSSAVSHFCISIIEATAPYACAFKFNLAFFEALGMSGLAILDRCKAAVPYGRITMADAKRGDIGNTARKYARAYMEVLEFDACTVSPYMGREAVTPFLDYKGKAAFVLVRTSNPGSDAIQLFPSEGRPLYDHVARQAADWENGHPGTIGFVVGATKPEDLHRIRKDHPATPLLIPGLGAQGGSLTAACTAATAEGSVLISSSRSILYASDGSDFAEQAGAEARAMRDRIRAQVDLG